VRPTLAAASGTGTTPRGREKVLCIVHPLGLIGDALEGQCLEFFSLRQDCARRGITVNSRQIKKLLRLCARPGQKGCNLFGPYFLPDNVRALPQIQMPNKKGAHHTTVNPHHRCKRSPGGIGVTPSAHSLTVKKTVSELHCKGFNPCSFFIRRPMIKGQEKNALPNASHNKCTS